jgi:methylated-DNA-[protein]-cysteine S-methyltransferase
MIFIFIAHLPALEPAAIRLLDSCMAYAPHHRTLATPIGPLILTGDERTLFAVHIGDDDGSAVEPDRSPEGSPVALAAQQIGEYFDGVRHSFDIPLAPLVSARGEALRAAIASIPYGETMSYGALARAHESGARAVGGACRRNPYPIIIPCHRVTSSNGAPENYSAGNGPDTKAWLLAHERRHAANSVTN